MYGFSIAFQSPKDELHNQFISNSIIFKSNEFVNYKTTYIFSSFSQDPGPGISGVLNHIVSGIFLNVPFPGIHKDSFFLKS